MLVVVPHSVRRVRGDWSNMYGLSPNCKKKSVPTRTVCENVSCLLVESYLLAHDEDPRAPVLANRLGRERPCYATGFQARRLTVFSSIFLLQNS
jgi:hypothetical protein